MFIASFVISNNVYNVWCYIVIKGRSFSILPLCSYTTPWRQMGRVHVIPQIRILITRWMWLDSLSRYTSKKKPRVPALRSPSTQLSHSTDWADILRKCKYYSHIFKGSYVELGLSLELAFLEEFWFRHGGKKYTTFDQGRLEETFTDTAS